MINLTFSITKVTILQGRGTDKISLWTTEPPTMPAVSSEPLCFDFQAAAGTGSRYIREEFALPDDIVEVINLL